MEKHTHVNTGNLYRRLCAAILALAIIITMAPCAFGQEYSETCLSLYYADATMKEGKSSKNAEQFFSSIAGIAIADLEDQEFLKQLAAAVDGKYKNFRVFVLHQKGMPATDLAMLYCFKNSTWLLKDTTSVNKSVYVDASWEVLQGLNLKLKQKELIKKVMPDYDNFYECKAKNVWQIYMQFVLFIEERNKAIQQMIEGSVDQIPELPEEIDDWPLDLPVSVQLPKELTILDATYTVEPAGSAAATFDQIPESQRYPGTVGKDNVVTGTLRFWEAGPHLVRLVFTASLNGQKQSLSHNLSIDTSSIRIRGSETCPLHEDGHQWQYDWAEEHPHYGRLICDCGAVMEDPTGATRLMLDCCECYGHEWTLAYYVWEGKGKAAGTCRRCGIHADRTESMPEYIRSYLDLLAERGEEGNVYFEEHSTGNTVYASGTAPWVYIADQSLTRYTTLTSYKESFMNTLADPVVSTIQMIDGEYDEKINISSKTELLWIRLIQEMLTGNDQEISTDSADSFAEGLDIGTDLLGTGFDMQTDYLKALADDQFAQNISKLEENLQAARNSLEYIKGTSTDPARILMEQDKVDQALKELGEAKLGKPDYTDANRGVAVKDSLPHIMNAISSLMEGLEAGEKVKEMRSAYIDMLNDYTKSREILDAIRKDAEARGNEDLENATETIIGIMDATYEANLGQYFDATTKIVDSLGNEVANADKTFAKTSVISFAEKEAQTVIMGAVDHAFTGISPISIATITAKIVKGVANYDEIFDTSTELAALSSMRRKSSYSLLESSDQVSPYTLALYAELEGEGCDKAAELVSTLSSETDIDNIMRRIIQYSFMSTNPALTVGTQIVDAMEVDVKEFGIGSNEKETVELMLRKEKESYDNYVRKCLRDAGKN